MHKFDFVVTQISAKEEKEGGAHLVSSRDNKHTPTHPAWQKDRKTRKQVFRVYTLVIPGQEQELSSTGTCFNRWLTQSIVLSRRLQMQLSGQEHSGGNCAVTPATSVPTNTRTTISTKSIFQ